MYDRILVPIDGSDVATSAARAAVDIARLFDSDLHVIHVVESEPYPMGFGDAMDELARYGREALETVEAQATDAGVDITTAVVDEGEAVHRAILGYADDNAVDLIVMGTHGRSGLGRMILGSVTEQTLRHSSVPVMTVHGETIVDTAFDSILVPFDGSAGAQGAVDHAIDLALAADARLYVVNVVDHAVMAGGDANAGMVLDALKESGERALDAVAERAADAGVEVGDTSVQVGSPFRTIVSYAEDNGMDCIVMGTRGRSGIDRVLLGSVTERVIRTAELPVIATKSEKQDE